MDPLRDRLAAVPRLRPALLIGGAALAVVVLVIAVLVAAAQASGSSAELPAARPISTAEPTPTALLVHVSGAVQHPGLVSLPGGSRVIDAVTAAGGPTAKADQGAINLAARIVDGQQIVLPQRGAAVPSTAGGPATSAAKVSLGSATAEQLETLPRIGPALAARIIAYRQAHGGFASVDDLGKVGGIGPKTLAGLRDLVTP